ncbi:MAG: DUF6701 domain-containing protein [Pseudomonadota bacterium]
MSRLILIRVVLVLASLACLAVRSAHVSAAVTYQAAGNAVSGVTSTGIGANPAWPAHAVNDIALLFIESTGGQAVTLGVPNGFVAVANSPQATGAGTAGTQLSVFWARATSTAMARPIIASPSDHFYAQIITFRGVLSGGNPIDATAGGVKAAASTSVTLGGVTTTVANALVVQAVARDNDSAAAAFSAQANATLTGITERLDAGTANGNGGGLGVWSGVKAAAGATGNTTATVSNSTNAFLTIALKPQPGASFQAAGAAVQGTGAVTPAWPAHAIGDLALLFVESTGGQAATLSTPAGFAAVLNSPQASGAGLAGTRISVFWARATSATMAPPTVADPGNHVYARILTYRNVVSAGNPWDVTGGGVKTPASTSVTVTGVTTTVADTLVVQAAARDNDSSAAAFSAQTNVNLSGITERHDAGTTQGNGGGFAVWDGYKATAGATGNTTATVTNSINAFLSIALRPQTAPAPVFVGLGGAVTVGLNWPAHAVDDVGLLFIETTGGQIPTLADAQGFVEVANSPQATGAGTAGTRLTVFWARATSTAMAGPTITGPTDHAYARIITYRGATNVGNPWDVTGGGVKGGTSNSVTVTGVTTTVANTRIVQAVARDNDSTAAAFSAQTNANLTGIAERQDAGTTAGNGGGFAVWDGAKAAAGATGNTTANVTSSRNAFLTIALKPPSAGGPDHYELSLPATGLACLASTATVTACSDGVSPCINKYLAASGTTATLATTGGTLGATTLTFDATGVATTTLSYPLAADGAVATVTLSAELTPALNPRKCCQGGVCVVANSCSTTFNTAAFIFSAAAGGAVATIPAQVAGISSATNYLRAVKTNTTTQACEAALVGASPVEFAYECNNPAACYASNLMSVNGGAATTIARNNNGAVASYLPVNLTFDANGNAPFTFNYADVGQVKLWARKAAGGSLLSALGGSTNAFVVKPHHFDITNIACTVVGAGTCAPANGTGLNPAASGPAGAAFIQAGRSFKATVTAMNGAATPAFTPNFGKEAAAEGAELTSFNHLPGLGGAGAISRVLSGFNSGASTLSDLAWNEVGVLQLHATLSNASGYLGSDVINGKNSVVSTVDPYAGRFIPDRFDTVVTPQGGGFAYSGNPTGPVPGQPFTVTVTAKNAAAAATSNYYNAGGYAKNVNLSVPVGGASGQLYVDAVAGGTGAVPAAKFLNLSPGEGKVNYSDATGKISFVFNGLPFAEQAIQVHAEDADTVTSSGANGAINIRHGRLRVFNAFGGEKVDLSLPLRAEYWTGNSWTINSADSFSVIPAAAVALSGYTGTLSAANLGASHVTGTTLAAGQGSIVLTKPAPVATGSVDLAINLGTGAADQSCLASHPATTAAAIPWLRSINGNCAITYDRDPSARASFGIYAPETRKTIHVRELY